MRLLTLSRRAVGRCFSALRTVTGLRSCRRKPIKGVKP
jgi:hypothetical protein